MKVISTFLVAIFALSFFTIATPDSTYAGTTTLPPNVMGCCEVDEACFTSQTCRDFGFPVTEGAICIESECVAQQPARNVPALTQWGFIALAGVMGIIGYIMLRRRKASV